MKTIERAWVVSIVSWIAVSGGAPVSGASTSAAAPGVAPPGVIAAGAFERVLRAEVTVKAPVEEAWKAWTTNTGIATFFAPQGSVDLEVDGTYDVWFDPSAPAGQRGAEGMRILDVDPLKRFAFTWNAPPSIASIRGKRTIVVLDFVAVDATTTTVRLTHLGWGSGPDWDKAFAYFDRAWGAVVLPRFVHRFNHGPIDWKSPPDVAPVASSIQTRLIPAP
jgi:uncharacterized protein YndB with AHSA1/START domain